MSRATLLAKAGAGRAAAGAGPAPPLRIEELPEVGRPAVGRFGRRFRRASWPTPLGELAVRFPPSLAAPRPVRWCRILVGGPESEAELWVPGFVPLRLLHRHHPDLVVDVLGRGELALLVHALLADHIAQWIGPDRILLEMDVDAPQPDPTDLITLCGTLGEDEIAVCMRLEATDERRLREFVGSLPGGARPFRDLPARVAFRCGHATLSLEEYSRLETGCGIVLAGTTLSQQKIVAVFAERYASSCDWRTISPVLEGPLLTRVRSMTKPFTARPDPADDDAGATGTIDDVPIHLVFEVGHADVTLAELEGLTEGHVFDLGVPLTQAVEILANGRRIGRGELVRLGEHIGVRVTGLRR